MAVATDLRKSPAQVLMATCADSEIASLLGECLGQPTEASDGSLLGGGGEGRDVSDKTKKRPEQQFLVATFQSLLVAGRHGIVDWVALRGELTTAMGGTLMIAEISLNKMVCN